MYYQKKKIRFPVHFPSKSAIYMIMMYLKRGPVLQYL